MFLVYISPSPSFSTCACILDCRLLPDQGVVFASRSGCRVCFQVWVLCSHPISM